MAESPGMRIALLITGGTFDKEYDELRERLFFRKTHVREMLAIGRSMVPTRMQTLMMKDSLAMTDRDRAVIARACQSSQEARIVITHGTGTMETTARYLAARVPGKTVVLTGAMMPYQFGSSDGLFNLGCALAYAQVLDAGVYVAMNGRLFDGDNVRKNRKAGRFEERRSRRGAGAH